MTVMLLTEHRLEFLSLKGGCTGSLTLHLSKCHIDGNLRDFQQCGTLTSVDSNKTHVAAQLFRPPVAAATVRSTAAIILLLITVLLHCV